MNCPNKNLKQYKDLVAIHGEKRATSLWVAYDGIVPESFYESQLNIQPQEEQKEWINSELFNEIASIPFLSEQDKLNLYKASYREQFQHHRDPNNKCR